MILQQKNKLMNDSKIIQAGIILLLLLITNASLGQEITIGNQIWLSKNLDVKNFRNGDQIPHIKSRKAWMEAAYAGKPAWTYYRNKRKNGKKYGILYNWSAVIDPRGLAPEGWRISIQEDWEQLTENTESKDSIGSYLKSPSAWGDGSTGRAGFNALPGGYLGGGFSTTHDLEQGKTSYWWCYPSSFYLTWGMPEDLKENAPSSRGLFQKETGIGLAVGRGVGEMINAAYIRCIKQN